MQKSSHLSGFSYSILDRSLEQEGEFLRFYIYIQKDHLTVVLIRLPFTLQFIYYRDT